MPRTYVAKLDAHLTAHAAVDPGVTIVDFQYTPGSTTVRVGDAVTWTNHGPSSHTATARDGSFNTGVLKPGSSASHSFTKPGIYTFYCQIHPFMHGTIIVLAAASPTGRKTTGTASPGSTVRGQSSASSPANPSASQSSPSSSASTSPANPSSTESSASSSASTSSGPVSPSPASPAQHSRTSSSSDESTAAPSSAPAETLPRTGANLAAGLVCGLVLLGVGVILRRRWGS